MSGGRRLLAVGTTIACWLAVAAVACVWASAWWGDSWTVWLAGLQAVMPWLGLVSSAVLVFAALTQRRALALAAGFVSLAVLVPALPTAVGRQSTDPASLTVAAANLRVDNATPADAAAAVLAHPADVLVVSELTPAFLDLLVAAGVDERYPFRLVEPAADPFGGGIWSRLPLEDAHVVDLEGLRVPVASVRIDGHRVRIVGVHTFAPLNRAALAGWRDQLGGLRAMMSETSGPTVVAGDFNATRWHPPFRSLVDQAGWVDAHEAVGRGLTASWPEAGGLADLGRAARLDHALVRDLRVLSVDDHVVPGSDHRMFTVGLGWS